VLGLLFRGDQRPRRLGRHRAAEAVTLHDLAAHGDEVPGLLTLPAAGLIFAGLALVSLSKRQPA
jgi:hypothetical protein